MIDARFGTYRGAIRLALSYVQVGTGQAWIKPPIAADVRRLVFVCHGNICRSAFADVVARQAGLSVASFGLSTSADKPAHPPAVAAAARLGHDMTAHRTTRVEDYAAQPGDLLLAMEVRHLQKIAHNAKIADVPRSLLGLWATPKMPHLHDPYELDPAYMDTCLRLIARTIPALVTAFPGAILSSTRS
jgi:protein-tyrosine phosphatase